MLLQFDIASDPRKPKFLKSSTALLPGKGNAVGGAVADHVFGLADGTYLTTQVGHTARASSMCAAQMLLADY